MTKVIAFMSMSLDGYVADENDGVDEVFDWYSSGDVEVPTASTTSGMTFHVSAPSAEHLKGLTAEAGAMLTGRRTFERADGWGGQHPWDVPAFVVTHHVPDGWPRKRRRSSEIGCRTEVRAGARRPDDPADPERRAARRDPHRSGCRVAGRGSAAVRPPCEHTGRPRESDSRCRCGCHASALSRARVVDHGGASWPKPAGLSTSTWPRSSRRRRRRRPPAAVRARRRHTSPRGRAA